MARFQDEMIIAWKGMHSDEREFFLRVKPTGPWSNQAQIPNIDKAKFLEIANGAKAGCPISRLLTAKISLDATLL